MCSTLALRALQLHAADPAALAALHDRSSWRLIPAYGVRDHGDLARITTGLAAWRAAGLAPAAILVDAQVAGLHGGTGQTAPWEVLAGFQPGVPVILAGGLTPDNVAEAIRIVQPYGVDVASGVERAPGVKDEEKLRRFIGNARAAAALTALDRAD
jgi:phosphoribosylanthranilate isomerase